MKKLIFGLVCFCSVSLIGTSTYAFSYVCVTSSTPSENNGFCRALSSGNGDMCFTYGSGPACSSTGSSGPVE